MRFSNLGKLLGKTASRLLLSASLFLLAGTVSSANAAVNNARSGRGTYDGTLMLLSAVGLMAFVARQRKRSGRRPDREHNE